MPWKTAPPRCALPCNGELVRYYRSLRGWTQGQLAYEAGYSERLVRKAEAGEPLHVDTIEVLAEALSVAGAPVHPEDLASVPKAIAKHLVDSYRQYQRQVVAATKCYLDDEMYAWIAGDPAVIPYAGEWRSIDGFDRFNQLLHDALDLIDSHAESYVAEGKHVFVTGSYTMRSRAKGEVQTISSVNEIVFERGKIIQFRNHIDTLTAANLLRSCRERQAGIDNGTPVVNTERSEAEDATGLAAREEDPREK